MPELPEVETVRVTLAPALGMRIASVAASGKALRGKVVTLRALTPLVGHRLVDMSRRGKYLTLTVGPHAIIVHLGMSGRLLWSKANVARPLHTHAVLADGKGYELRFIDARRFGQFDVVPLAEVAAHPALAGLGVDPILDGLAPGYLHGIAKRRATPIKALILDQTIIAGVGNIYASEALWLAGVHPQRQASLLTAAQCASISEGVVASLQHAITKGGTSLRDFVSGTGTKGENAAYLRVYGRAGTPCQRCGAAIKSFALAGRTTYCCPRCQPAPRRGMVTGP